jgi:hypothetical protein
MEGLAHGAEHLAQAGGLGGRRAERLGHLLRVEAERLAGGGGAEDAGRSGDVPAAIVMLRIDRVADAALDLDAEDEGVSSYPTPLP